MTVLLCVSRSANACLASPFAIFRKWLNSYPILGTPDNDLYVAYQTQKNSWLDSLRFAQCMHKKDLLFFNQTIRIEYYFWVIFRAQHH